MYDGIAEIRFAGGHQRAMGIENRLTLFAATDTDLNACFPGWRMPLPEPRVVELICPFTKKPITLQTWDPGRAPEAGLPRSIRVARRRRTWPFTVVVFQIQALYNRPL